jgi:excisionase family DNA binding protein
MTSAQIETLIAQLQGMVNKSNERLVSKAEAARRLGVSRTATLGSLIASGAIKSVVIGRRVKIPVSELDRLCRDGVRELGSANRVQARAPRRITTKKAVNIDEQREALRAMRL